MKGKVWSQNGGLPRAKVEYTIDRMVQVGNIKPELRPKYEDYVAVSIVEEAMKRFPLSDFRLPIFDFRLFSCNSLSRWERVGVREKP